MQRPIFHLFSVLLALSDSAGYSQISFQKTYGGIKDDAATGILESFDGGYVICGFTKSFGAGNNDALLIKTDQFGDTLWTRLYGGIKDDIAYSMIQTVDSGFLLVGTTSSFGDGEEDVWLIKTNETGDTLWTKTYGAAHEEYGFSVEQTSDKGFIVAGSRYSNVSYDDPCIFLTDSMGNLLWSKSFTGDSWDYAFSAIEQNSAGGITYLVAGFMSGNQILSSYAPFLIKLNQDGDTIWTKRYFDDEDDYGIFDYHGYVRKTIDGGLILAGSTGSVYEGYVLIKMDAEGNYEWINGYGGTGLERIEGVEQTTDHGFVLSGYSDSFGFGGYDFFVVKIDSVGNVSWSKVYGGSEDETRGVFQQVSDGGYIIGGSTTTFGAGNSDIYFVKTNEVGISGCNEMSVITVTTPIVSNVHSGLKFSNPTTNVQVAHPDLSLPQFEPTNLCLATTAADSALLQQLLEVIPNPLSTSTLISFSLSQSENAFLKVFDLHGRLIRTLADEVMSAGAQTITWDARDENGNPVSDGIYLLQVESSSLSITEKLIITK